MRRSLFPIAATGTLIFAACQNTDSPLAPADVALPAFSMSQEVERVVGGRVLARLTPGTDAEAVGRAYGLEVEALGRDHVIFRGAAAGSERSLAARMGTNAQVVWAEPDYLRETTRADDGTGIDPRLWAFHNPGNLAIYYTRGPNSGQPVSSLRSLADADEDNAPLNYAAGGSPVKIASIDTGVDLGHAEFSGTRLTAGWDYYSNDADPTDENGHGTHTTGTMVGNTVGVAGVAGASNNVTVYVYRVCGPQGCPTSAIVSAIRAAADQGVVAMNLSLGGSSLSQAEADAIGYALGKGSLVIASAGNGSTGTVSCPACDPRAISVAATDWLDQHAYYTNWGPGLDIIAPGGELYSNTTEEAGIYSAVPGGYAYYQGTSMAAPQVTGTAAVVASVQGLTGAALRAQIEGTTDDLGASGYDTSFGHGRLNSYRAVTGSTVPPTPEPLVASYSYGCSGRTCSFDGSGSTGSPTSYDWTFGDGGTASGVTTSHTFAGVGNYVVTLTVGNGTDTDSTSRTIACTKRGPNVRCR